MITDKILSNKQHDELINLLSARFEKNMHRHKGLVWLSIQSRLEASPGKLWTLQQMEETAGEPDVIGFDKTTGEFLFCDCSKESPGGRRSLCFDNLALATRKEHKPAGSALGMADEMGLSLLSEEQYRDFQQTVHYDTKTSTWLVTPPAIRELGGALFGDYRYGRVFVYHNGAESYYAARGFRGLLRV